MNIAILIAVAFVAGVVVSNILRAIAKKIEEHIEGTAHNTKTVLVDLHQHLAADVIRIENRMRQLEQRVAQDIKVITPHGNA